MLDISKPDLTKQRLPIARTHVMTETVRLLKADGRPIYVLAELADVNHNTLSRWLDGTTINGRLPVLVKVLTVLGYGLEVIPLTRPSSGFH